MEVVLTVLRPSLLRIPVDRRDNPAHIPSVRDTVQDGVDYKTCTRFDGS